MIPLFSAVLQSACCCCCNTGEVLLLKLHRRDLEPGSTPPYRDRAALWGHKCWSLDAEQFILGLCVCVCVRKLPWAGGAPDQPALSSPPPISQQEVAPSSRPHQSGNICSLFWNPGTRNRTSTKTHTHTHTMEVNLQCEMKDPVVMMEGFAVSRVF